MAQFVVNAAYEHFSALMAKVRPLCRVEDRHKALSERFARSTMYLLLNGLSAREE
jgi:hypothetical protein